MKIYKALIIAFFLTLPTGCILTSRDQIYSTSPTGDELLSLKRAKDTGILSEDEYLELRKRLIARAMGEDKKE